MKNKELSNEEWQKLFELASEFQKLAPWDWLADIDMFGVMDAKTKEIGYCSVMGSNGEFYALGIYPGAEGFASFDRMARGDVPSSMSGKLQVQRCLMLSFDKRDLVKERDMKKIKETGVRFDNRNFWPVIEDYTPGFYPWQVANDDLRFMTRILEQAIIMLSDFKERAAEMVLHTPDKIMVKIPTEKSNKVKWNYEYLTPEKYLRQEKIPTLNEADEIRARKLQKSTEVDFSLEWEIDTFSSREPVRGKSDDGRPFFPLVVIIIDHSIGRVETVNLAEQGNAKFGVFRRTLIDAIDKASIIPKSLLLRDSLLAETLQPVADIFKIEIIMSDNLGMLDEAKESFLNDCFNFRK